MFRKILCPVDFSAGSREALRVAAGLASESGAPLVLVHAWEASPWAVGSEAFMSPDVIQEMVDSAEAELGKWKTEAMTLGAKEVAVKFTTGVPWDQIVSAARDDPAIDLIVMGTHGRTGFKHALIGSVAEKVVRHAPCPVLVVRSREKAPAK